jgi:hypothetical protein
MMGRYRCSFNLGRFCDVDGNPAGRVESVALPTRPAYLVIYFRVSGARPARFSWLGGYPKKSFVFPAVVGSQTTMSPLLPMFRYMDMTEAEARAGQRPMLQRIDRGAAAGAVLRNRRAVRMARREELDLLDNNHYGGGAAGTGAGEHPGGGGGTAPDTAFKQQLHKREKADATFWQMRCRLLVRIKNGGRLYGEADDARSGGDGTALEDAISQLQALLLARIARTDDDDDEDENKKMAAIWCRPLSPDMTLLHHCASTYFPSRHWEWILEHCPNAAVVSAASSSSLSLSPLVAHQTELGETVVDVFFQHRLGQRFSQPYLFHVHAQRLVAVLARADRTVIAALPTTEADILRAQEVESLNEPAVIDAEHEARLARTFLCDLYLLLRKIALPRPDEPMLDWMMTALATIGPSVPVIVAEWMELYLYHVIAVATSSSSRLSTTTTTGQQAKTWNISSSKQKSLHILCQTKPLAHLPRQSPPLLSMFLTKQGANSVIAETGRLPMEQALQSGWCFEGLSELWKLTTTTTPPPVSLLLLSSSSSLSTTGWLPLCAFAAMTTTDDNDQKDRAVQILVRHQRQKENSFSFASEAWSEEAFLAVARHDCDLAQLTSIYECLRAAPSSVRRRSGNAS